MPLSPVSAVSSTDAHCSLLDMDDNNTSPPASPRPAVERHLSPRGDCLDSGLQVLSSSIDQARADCQATEDCHKIDCDTDCQWWASLLQRLSAQHQAERAKWNADLHKAKTKGRGYREQLKSEMTSRLQWLEGHARQQEQQQPLSRTSTSTTQSSEDDSPRPLPKQPRDPEAQNNGGVEVSYDQAQLLQQLTAMEQSLQEHEREKGQWQRALELASHVTEEGEKLSASMQAQLYAVVDQLDGNRAEKWKEKVEVQKQLLDLVEQQHQTAEYEWKAERSKLTAAIDQLTADKLELKSALEESERKRARDEKKYRTAREEFARERKRLEATVARYKGGEVAGSTPRAETPPASPRLKLQRSDSLSTLSPRHATDTAAAEPALTTALAERDAARAEVEQLRKLLRRRSRSSSRPRTTPSPQRNTPPDAPTPTSRLLKLKEREYQAELERQLKKVRDEYTSVIADLEEQLEQAQRRGKSSDKRQELVTRVKELERKRDEEKGEWKLRLEGALAKNRRLSEAKVAVEKELASLQARFDKEAQQWHDRVHEAEQEQSLRSDQLQESLSKLEQHEQQAMQERERMEEITARHEAEMKEWEDKVEELAERYETEIAELKEHHDRANQEWDVILEAARLKERDQLEDTREQHRRETQEWIGQLEEAQQEKEVLKDRTNELQQTIDKLKSAHSLEVKKMDCDFHGLLEERDSRILELELRIEMADESTQDKARVSMVHVQESICNAVEELRKDVATVRETLESSAENNRTIEHAQLSASVEAMQSTLNDAVAELTLGTESMMEVKELTEDTAKALKAQVSSEDFTEQQTRLLSEMGDLRAQLSDMSDLSNKLQALAKKQADGAIILQDAMRTELVEALHRKESELCALRAELAAVNKQLTAKTAQLASAEDEIATLNDQADAYGEELMRTQAVIAGLEETIKVTQRKLEERTANDSYEDTDGDFDDDTMPMLDEALALARGLTDVVHGQGDDADMLDLLRNLSDMIDEHERTAATTSPVRSATPPRPPRRRRPHLNVERPPEPVETPKQSPRALSTSLQLVVEELYGRCQLLERERTQMMEVTLDLLEAARESSAAELEAALATARRKSLEEVTRMHQQTQVEKERLYQRLCQSCAKGVHGLLETPR